MTPSRPACFAFGCKLPLKTFLIICLFRPPRRSELDLNKGRVTDSVFEANSENLRKPRLVERISGVWGGVCGRVPELSPALKSPVSRKFCAATKNIGSPIRAPTSGGCGGAPAECVRQTDRRGQWSPVSTSGRDEVGGLRRTERRGPVASPVWKLRMFLNSFLPLFSLFSSKGNACRSRRAHCYFVRTVMEPMSRTLWLWIADLCVPPFVPSSSIYRDARRCEVRK